MRQKYVLQLQTDFYGEDGGKMALYKVEVTDPWFRGRVMSLFEVVSRQTKSESVPLGGEFWLYWVWDENVGAPIPKYFVSSTVHHFNWFRRGCQPLNLNYASAYYRLFCGSCGANISSLLSFCNHELTRQRTPGLWLMHGLWRVSDFSFSSAFFN